MSGERPVSPQTCAVLVKLAFATRELVEETEREWSGGQLRRKPSDRRRGREAGELRVIEGRGPGTRDVDVCVRS